MGTIKEDYVSFEIAKLLREKGFDYSSYCHYRLNDGELCNFNTNCNTNLKQNDYITAPTLQMAMKWLREVHNILIVIEPHRYDYINEKFSSYVASLWQGDNYYENVTSKDYPTYEEAVEATLKFSLENLI